MATVHEITHDAGGVLSDYWGTILDTDGVLSLDAAAGLDGTAFGMLCDYSSLTTQSRVVDSFVALSGNDLRMRVWINVDNLTHSSAGSTTIFVFAVPLPQSVAPILGIRIFIRSNVDNSFKYAFIGKEDGDVAPSSIGATTFDLPTGQGEHCIELRAIKETSDGAADGIVQGFFDGVSKVLVTNYENFNNFIAFTSFGCNCSNAASVGGDGYFDEMILDDNPDANLGCGTVHTLAPMTKPVDIDADGSNLYLALLDSGNPILIKMATSLDADGSTVFEPGAGDDIGVQCGRFDADVIWVAGAFDGTNVVEKSEDGGTTFTVKDPATFGDVEAFVVGPDSDIRVLIADNNIDIQETLDDGDTWTAINSGTGFNVNAIARLDKNVQECAFGNDAGANDNVDFSPNSGGDMEDFSAGFPTEDATRVIVN